MNSPYSPGTTQQSSFEQGTPGEDPNKADIVDVFLDNIPPYRRASLIELTRFQSINERLEVLTSDDDGFTYEYERINPHAAKKLNGLNFRRVLNEASCFCFLNNVSNAGSAFCCWNLATAVRVSPIIKLVLALFSFIWIITTCICPRTLGITIIMCDVFTIVSSIIEFTLNCWCLRKEGRIGYMRERRQELVTLSTALGRIEVMMGLYIISSLVIWAPITSGSTLDEDLIDGPFRSLHHFAPTLCPFTTWKDKPENMITGISRRLQSTGEVEVAPVWRPLYNHDVVRLGVSPNKSYFLILTAFEILRLYISTVITVAAASLKICIRAGGTGEEFVTAAEIEEGYVGLGYADSNTNETSPSHSSGLDGIVLTV